MHQIPPAKSLSYSLTYEEGISTPFSPRFENSDSYLSFFELSRTVILSITEYCPCSLILDLIFSASSGRT